MRRSHWASIFAAAAIGASLAPDARASVPVGVWARVESMTFEPSEASATRVQIRGAVMLFDNSTGGPYLGYTSPALGTLDYVCPAGKEATCQLEWQDIKKNIGAPPNECVGFGDQLTPTGTLHANGAPLGAPDTYPLAMGVTGGFSPCQVLADFLAKQPDGGASSSSSSSSSGATTTTTTTATTATTTSTTTTHGTGGTTGNDTSEPGNSSGCTVNVGERGGALGASLSLLALAALSARLGARRRR